MIIYSQFLLYVNIVCHLWMSKFLCKKKKPTKKNYDEIIKFSRENFISQTDKPVTASKPVIRCNNTKFWISDGIKRIPFSRYINVLVGMNKTIKELHKANTFLTSSQYHPKCSFSIYLSDLFLSKCLFVYI